MTYNHAFINTVQIQENNSVMTISLGNATIEIERGLSFDRLAAFIDVNKNEAVDTKHMKLQEYSFGKRLKRALEIVRVIEDNHYVIVSTDDCQHFVQEHRTWLEQNRYMDISYPSANKLLVVKNNEDHLDTLMKNLKPMMMLSLHTLEGTRLYSDGEYIYDTKRPEASNYRLFGQVFGCMSADLYRAHILNKIQSKDLTIYKDILNTPNSTLVRTWTLPCPMGNTVFDAQHETYLSIEEETEKIVDALKHYPYESHKHYPSQALMVLNEHWRKVVDDDKR